MLLEALSEAEDVGPFQEELPLLGIEQAEAGQVELLLVGFDLGEIGVDGQVGGDVRSQAGLDVQADGGGPEEGVAAVFLGRPPRT